jgi:uncharacterized protein involved in exopolysaccharide biosynthesis
MSETNASNPASPRRRHYFLRTAGLVLLLALGVALVVTAYLRQREYFAKVVIEVKPDNLRVIGPVFGHGQPTRNDPQFVRTQAQILHTKTILYPVIQDLRLIDEWSGEGDKLQLETVYRKLCRMLDVRPIRDTNLIEIGVYSPSAVEAARIANTMAVRYRDTRLTRWQKRLDNDLNQLKEEMDKQEKRVKELRMEMMMLRQRDRIIDPDPESSASVLGTSARNLVAVETQLNEQHLLVAKLERQHEETRKISPEDSKEEQSQGTKLAIEKGTLAALEERFKSLEDAQIREKERLVEYAFAKSRYLQAKAILQAAQGKLSTEIIERGIDFEPATIWEKAEPSLYPASVRFLRLWNVLVYRLSG